MLHFSRRYIQSRDHHSCKIKETNLKKIQHAQHTLFSYILYTKCGKMIDLLQPLYDSALHVYIVQVAQSRYGDYVTFPIIGIKFLGN